MCGTFGFELNLGTIGIEERSYVTKYIDMYKSLRDVIVFGNLYRLWDPKDDSVLLGCTFRMIVETAVVCL